MMREARRSRAGAVSAADDKRRLRRIRQELRSAAPARSGEDPRGDQRHPAGRRGSGAADHLHGGDADHRQRCARRVAADRAPRPKARRRQGHHHLGHHRKAHLRLRAAGVADAKDVTRWSRKNGANTRKRPRSSRATSRRPYGAVRDVMEAVHKAGPQTTSCSGPKRSRETSAVERWPRGATRMAMDAGGGTQGRASRHQRHAAHRRRAGAADHLHGAGAVDAERADREHPAKDESDTPPDPSASPIVVEYTGNRELS